MVLSTINFIFIFYRLSENLEHFDSASNLCISFYEKRACNYQNKLSILSSSICENWF